MNAYNPISTMHKLEAVGFEQRQAATLAEELHHATTELVTRTDLEKALAAQADKITLRLGGLMAALIAVAVTLSKLFA